MAARASDPDAPSKTETVTSDPWSHLRQLTSARIALGRAGGSLPTHAWLDFKLAHARARDAVHAPFDTAAIAHILEGLGQQYVELSTRAENPQAYLQTPQLGRQLSAASLQILRGHRTTLERKPDLAIIIGDGLSAHAVHTQSAAFLGTLLPLLDKQRLALAPVAIVRHARVAVQDPIGAALGARAALILLGERPGLGSADSLGAYFVLNPQLEHSDADRNCLSNIREGGMPPARAASKACWLIVEALRRGVSGVRLKDETEFPLDSQVSDGRGIRPR